MILKFPNLDTLRLALTTAAVPPGVSQGPAIAGFDDQDQVWVETSAPLPRASQNELRRLGVQVVRASGATLTTEVSCWPELLPLQPDPTPVERLEQTPVLFDLADGEDLARLAIEILRLGNDRQGFRWLEARGGRNGDGHGLLRVVGPPYYSLLRALDHQGQKAAPVAYVERAPRLWMEVGYTHPLAEKVRPPKGKLLLLRPPRQWTLIDDAPFRDIYEVVEFTLPDGPARWRDTEPRAHLRVAPSLRPGGPPEGAELWVLRDQPVEELNRFVQNADDQMLGRLAFAVGEKGGRTTIVLRVRQAKVPPPVLVLKADAYRQYLKLPNLFLPAGTRLHPPLRRDVVRKLLAEDPAQVTWLAPGAGGSFTPESLPEDAFRPLADWIDYVLDRDREALEAWIQAARFDFEPFVCSEDEPAKPKKPPAPERKGAGKKPPSLGRAQEGPDAVAYQAADRPAPAAEAVEEPDDLAAVVVEPGELEKQLTALEEQFLAGEGGLDTPERQALWPEMARLNAVLGKNTEDAAICWLNALWGQDAAPPAWVRQWLRSEALAFPAKGRPAWAARLAAEARNAELPPADLDRLLATKEPAAGEVRALAAYLVWAARRTPPPLLERLDRVQRYLEAHEKLLPVRAAWLAWLHAVQLSRGDVLALARARDRLLERLYHNGLRPEQDLPGFLRFAGEPTSQRFRGVRQWMLHLADLAHQWANDNSTPDNPNPPTMAGYIDLFFAFGLARLGEHDACKDRLQRAVKVLTGQSEAHTLLLTAFQYRIAQALEGRPHAGPLPADILREVEALKPADKQTQGQSLEYYAVERMRQQHRILEPEQEVDAYQYWTAHASPLDRALAELANLSDRQEAAARAQRLLRDVPRLVQELRSLPRREGEQPPGPADVRAAILREALNQAPRVGEEFAREMLQQVTEAYDALPAAQENNDSDFGKRASLLQRGLFAAAHFDHLESIQPLVSRFGKLIRSQRGGLTLQELNRVLGKSFRSLRKLGMRDEIDYLLTQMDETIRTGQGVKGLDPARLADRWEAMVALLHVAGGYYYFGRGGQAEPVLRVAREILFKLGLGNIRAKTDIARTYAVTAGQGPVEVAKQRLEEIFTRLKGVKNGWTTERHYNRSQLEVIEAVVMAVVGDDFTLGASARRWLDDDEFLVRRRIHRDLRATMAQTS